ncbi:hypothetical protein CFY86_13900 [Raoultella ornithinolytica]|uniref:Ead/Ea22-like family protein n=1 Tax=Raoultella ornithinolytica TaxID=54291 RepID=A0A855EZ03_RAOOR|nr:hypothetical protein [Raoultella ornithinolytica]PIK83640.1 hypothetical protein CFY86_13900 [Raoultella ornithinolytica]
MTTDITELAKREKFEAWWEREYKHLESSKYTDAVPHIKYGFWMAYQAGGAELVEALKKAKTKIIELQQGCENDPRTHEIIDLQERIAELESRAVKLPPTVSVAGIDVYEAGLVRILLTAAGIKWEAE